MSILLTSLALETPSSAERFRAQGEPSHPRSDVAVTAAGHSKRLYELSRTAPFVNWGMKFPHSVRSMESKALYMIGIGTKSVHDQPYGICLPRATHFRLYTPFGVCVLRVGKRGYDTAEISAAELVFTVSVKDKVHGIMMQVSERATLQSNPRPR